VEEKVKALEQIDQLIVGPVLEALPTHGDWRILVSPDHRTPLATRAHGHGPVPFAMAGTGIAAAGQVSYDEVAAADRPLSLDKGHELMRRFLN
jgi:2,3-bisphosphoglycerate-independent phosphoglycerate mutase